MAHAELQRRHHGKKARISFSHPLVSSIRGDLVLHVNPNDVIWSYGLNTANFPTYGGEVVQILSMFFEDMTITGDVRGYGDIERIYGWFLTYIQAATQGQHGKGSYDSHPVKFTFTERGWHFDIYPKKLPGFKYGRDITVPSYTIVAAVLEPDPTLKDLITSEAAIRAATGGTVDVFGKASAAIGYREDNPFSGPTSFDKATIKKFNDKEGDFFQGLVAKYLDGNFKDLEVSSKPPEFATQFADPKKSTKSKNGGINPSQQR